MGVGESDSDLIMKKRDWYSNGLTYKKANELEKKYAKITSPEYGLNIDNNDALTLSFQLRLEDGGVCDFSMTHNEDISQLLIRAKARKVEYLEGKVIEAWEDNGLVRAISVNEKLI